MQPMRLRVHERTKRSINKTNDYEQDMSKLQRDIL